MKNNMIGKNRHTLRRLFSYVKKHNKLLALSVLTGIFRYLIPITVPLALKVLVDDFLAANGKRILLELHLLMGGLCVLYVIYAVISYFRSYFVGILGHRIIFDLQKTLYLHLQKMSLSYFDNHRVGEVVSRMTGDIGSAQNLVGSAIVNAVMDVVFLTVVVFVLFMMNLKLALISLTVMPFYVFIHCLLSERIRATTYNIRDQAEKISGELHEQFASISVIQAFTQEENRALEFNRQNRKYFWALRSNLKLQSLALGLTGFLTAFGPILVLWMGAMEVWNGKLTVGALMAFYAYLGMLYQPIQRLAELKLVLSSSIVSIDRIFEAFDTYPEVQDLPGAKKLDYVVGNIEFNNVTFGYYESRPIFKNFYIKIPAGTAVALVGQSGAGKSSFASLLLRFYDIDKGSITIDGWDIRKVTLKSLRKNIAFVPQNPILLSGTIEENLRFGKSNATMDEICHAAERAFADKFIEKLPRGYKTEIGELGARLSGGEKQRIAIARAFLKNAPILILDEPTSALDSESEESIKLALRDLVSTRTTIIISHRLTTIEFFNRIIWIDNNGEIVKEGTCKEFKDRRDNPYRNFVANQSGKAITT